MKRLPVKLSYANVVSTLALFLAIGGGAAFAASKIQSSDIAPGAVKTSNLHARAVSSGKLGVGAVRSNQIANGAVDRPQIASGAVGSGQISPGAITTDQIKPESVQPSSIASSSITSQQIKPGSIQPSSLAVPLSFSADPSGGPIALPTGAPVGYPLNGASWTQNPGQINVIFGEANATLAYDGAGSGSCEAFVELLLNGLQVGGGNLSTSSEEPTAVQGALGANPEIDPPAPRTNTLTARVATNGDCTETSVVDSSRFRVLTFG